MANPDKKDPNKGKYAVLPHELGFNNHPELVWSAYRIYRAEGRVPTKEEAAAIDDDWFDDVAITAPIFVQHVKDKRLQTASNEQLGIE